MFQLRTCVTTRTTEMQPEILGEIGNNNVKVFFEIFWFGVVAHPVIRKMFCLTTFLLFMRCRKKRTGKFAMKERIKLVQL